MTAATHPSPSVATREERVAPGRLWWVGPLAIIAAVIGNGIVRLVAGALVEVSPEFLPLQSGWVMFTAVGVLGATFAYAGIARFARRPARTFAIVSAVVLALSFIPNILLLVAEPNPQFPGITVPLVWVLMVMHVVAAAIAVPLLIGLTRPR